MSATIDVDKETLAIGTVPVRELLNTIDKRKR